MSARGAPGAEPIRRPRPPAAAALAERGRSAISAAAASAPVAPFDAAPGLHSAFVGFVQALAGYSRVPVSSVRMEHSYARAGGAAGPATAEGTRLLLVRRAPRCPDCHLQLSREEDVDVETVEKEPIPPLMLDELPYWEKGLVDCDMVAEEDDHNKPDWEEKLHGLAWNSAQSSLLNETLEIIHGTRAALLTAGVAGAKRAAARGGGARSLRALLAAPQTRWQACLAQWLHNALTEHLPTPLLACYRDIMLTMKSKVPILVDKMTVYNPLTGRVQGAENGTGGPTIASANAPSDPSAPILLLVPSGRDKRDARWAERLRAVAQVHIVHSHQTSWPPNLPVSACLSQLVNTARSRTETLKVDNPRRPLVLVGQGPGAAIAVQLAVTVPGIAGVVCLGLPLLTANGMRGTPDDTLLDLPCPVLFVIGQNASNATQQDVENLRCNLGVKSRLVVAGGADELLRLPRLKRQLEGITQRMLECAIADEVSSFLSFLLNQDGDVCSSPDSYGRLEGERDVGHNSMLTLMRGIESKGMNNRRRPPSPNQMKRKRPRMRFPVKSPIKSRSAALYEVNNPPPEGATVNIGDIQNATVIIDDDDSMMGTKVSLSPPSKHADRNSYGQIPEDRIRLPVSGNGSYNSTSASKKGGIRVLENIPYKSPNLTATLLKNAIAKGSGSIKTQIICRKPQVPQTDQESQPNIMDLPIVFADDNKSGENESKQSNKQNSLALVKPIVVNKQQMVTHISSNDIKQSLHKQTNNFVQVQSSVTSNSPNSMKCTKVILPKRPAPPPSSGISVVVNPDGTKNQVLNKPIIVKSNSIKVLQGSIIQNAPGKVFQNKQRYIIKRAVVPSGLNMSANDAKKLQECPKVDGESLRQNAKKDSTIEAAVASITGQDYMKNMLENFD